MDNRDFTIAVYNQYWTHARHVEDERFKFMTIHFAVLGAIYYAAYVYNLPASTVDITQLRMVVVLIGAVLSFITLLMTLKFEFLFKWYSKTAQDIVAGCGYRRLMPEVHAPFMIRKISIHKIFPVFYYICIGLQLVLLIYQLPLPCRTVIMAAIGLFWVSTSLLFYFDHLPGFRGF